jgi:hypothetical protein
MKELGVSIQGTPYNSLFAERAIVNKLTPVVSNSDVAQTPPTTFKDVFQTSEGDNLLQRAMKSYLKPRGNPETTIKVLEVLQVDQFQKVPKAWARFHLKAGRRYQSNYTVKDSSLASFIDYGTHQSGFNDTWHFGALMVTGVIPGILDITSGNTNPLPFLGAAALVNTYCILAQRYSRARIERIVDRRLARGERMGRFEHNNHLNLKLPE